MNFNQIKQQLQKYTVGIAGCGGLGSNCAVALARVGIGKLVIVDFDVVSESNLNRQYFFYDQIGQEKASALKININRINPNTIVEEHILKLDSKNIQEVFANCDVIVEAFDLAEMKEMIIDTVQGKMPDVYLISALGLAGWGNSNIIRTQSHGNLVICGDLINEVSETCPALAPRVGIVSNMQANQVLEIILGKM